MRASKQPVEHRYPNLCRDIIAGQYKHPSSEPPLCLSGASEGADETFGSAAMNAGHIVAHVMGPRNVPSQLCAATQADALYNVSDEMLNNPLITSALGKAIVVRAGIASRMTGAVEDCRRNYLQVRQAEACLCVAYRHERSADVMSKLDMGGGTGWAAQWYVDRFKPQGPEDPAECRLYLWDDGNSSAPGCLIDPATHLRWNLWRGDCWVPLGDGEAPPLSNFRIYAGIGATRLSESGQQAIHALYGCTQ